MSELVTFEKLDTMEIFTKEKGVDLVLTNLKDLVESHKGDVTTKKGRDEIKSFCYKITKTKTHIDKVGKDLVAVLKEKPKLIDAERRRVKELLDGWIKECRKPLTEFEEAEAERIEKIKSSINFYQSYSDSMFLGGLSKDDCKLAAQDLKSKTSFEDCDEFAEEAEKARDQAVLILRGRYAELLEEEAEAKAAAEAAEKARIEREEQIKAQAKAEAEAETKRKQEEIEALEAKAIKDAEIAEQQRLEAIKQAEDARLQAARDAEAAEARRIEQEKAAKAAAAQALKDAEIAAAKAAADAKLKAEQDAEHQLHLAKKEEEKRAKNKAHKAKVHNEAYEHLVGLGLTEEQAKAVVIAIAKGEVPHVKLNY